ncbi:SMI1/KNR4 family protein [Paraburkholderia antibiotica]|uniref:SMI1/KNR4 family protein n=1 Tax=Paraburkholderia antibiotica TaxID=2728839 RepID=A0A7Y0FGY4_9BURK|nr:SMI1/KNR4 family protein [Paraburkholderia antibiotica]NML35538.1 SMI1/KNR4 family protein [Paraburkholderia antibiotica]
MEYEQLRNELQTILTDHPDEGRSYGGRSERAIKAVETLLGLTLPSSYRKFVADFGAVDFYGFEVYGIPSEDPAQETSVPSCAWLTRSEREHGLPSGFLVIGSSGDGLTYVLSAIEPNAMYAYGGYEFEANPPKEIAGGFNDFLRSYIEQAKRFIDEDSM